MGKREAQRFNEKLERDVRHMFNDGARRDAVLRYVVHKIVTADSTFSSNQLMTIFEMVL